MPKKSKSKPRTNWKARALHCEEVIKIQNVLAESREAKVRDLGVTIAMQNYELDYKGRDLVGLQDDIEKLTVRAESAEKHNALLLEEREAKNPNRTVCSGCHRHECHGECMVPVRFHEDSDLDEAADRLLTAIFENPPTHWQRFKSWLSRRGK